MGEIKPSGIMGKLWREKGKLIAGLGIARALGGAVEGTTLEDVKNTVALVESHKKPEKPHNPLKEQEEHDRKLILQIAMRKEDEAQAEIDEVRRRIAAMQNDKEQST